MIGSELSGCGDIDIIQNIHIEMPKINIIALSSSEKIEEFICCIRDGAKGYISKNSSTESSFELAKHQKFVYLLISKRIQLYEGMITLSSPHIQITLL